MKHEFIPCTDGDGDFLEKMLEKTEDAIVPSTGCTEEETIVYKITDKKEHIIAGCIAEIDTWQTAELDVL